MRYINLNYVAPASTYKFDNNSKYILVFINTGANSTNIHKCTLDNIDNITESIRGYPIKLAFQISNSLFYPTYAVLLFRQSSKLELLFAGSLEINKLELNSTVTLNLYRPPSISIDKSVYLRSSPSGDLNLLSEQFYNFNKPYINPRTSQRCSLIITLTSQNPQFNLIKPISIMYDRSNYLMVYNRYSNSIVKETNLSSSTSNSNSQLQYNSYSEFLDRFCNSRSSYSNYIKLLQRDDSTYTNIGTDDFNTLLTRQIKLDYRPLYVDPYSSTTIVSPVDGRIRAFNISPSLKITAYNKSYGLDSLLQDCRPFMGGSGFMCRVSPQDYQRVYIPFSGDVNRISYHNGNIVSLKVHSNYFMPKSVHERDYTSVYYGEPTGSGIESSSRVDPSLLKVDPDTKLVYYIIIISPTSKTKFTFTNKKLVAIQEQIKDNEFLNLNPVTYQQGEEIGKVNCGSAYIVVLCNRQIDFSSDIAYMSKMISESSHLARPMDCLVRTRDIVGSIN